MSISRRPFSSSATVDVASSAISHAKSDLQWRCVSKQIPTEVVYATECTILSPFLDELGADAALDDLQHLLLVGDVDLEADIIAKNLDAVFERLAVCADDDGRVHLLLEPRARLVHHFSGWKHTTPVKSDAAKVNSFLGDHQPRMITEVVPSPTSSSCVRAISIIDLAAGCSTMI